MNDTSDTLPKPRRRSRKPAAPAATAQPVPEVQAILDQALHPTDAVPEGDPDAPAPGRRAPRRRRRGKAKAEASAEAAVAQVAEQVVGPALEQAVEAAAESVASPEVSVTGPDDAANPAAAVDRSDDPHDESDASGRDDQPHHDDAGDAPGEQVPPPDDGGRGDVAAAPPSTPHHWVYLAVAVFLLSLGFGLWGVWTTFFASADDDRSAAALRAAHETLSQEVTILRRSDQISRDANRDLERTLAERDEEIAGLRADVAFYERFVGATGQRRGLSVHDLEMRLQSGEVWHFVATLTQNVNRGAVNSGRVTLSVEGTRNDRLERLSWSALRKQNNAPGQPYSFKYFQQVEGEVMLPQGFKPLRVTVRLVPQGGSAVEQSFPWPDAVRSASAAD
jgi:hypothetical protein